MTFDFKHSLTLDDLSELLLYGGEPAAKLPDAGALEEALRYEFEQLVGQDPEAFDFGDAAFEKVSDLKGVYFDAGFRAGVSLANAVFTFR
ncbi:MAG: hypothetical protein ACOX65_03070 [Anaerotruncus rubiinfantis]|jgi:hypothetical protein|uniref:hypothetical protein n=1 Tax=Anaerotruncus rubiinfantis TaxID=1720200 RepID=UPI00189ABF55|nr:hypothetical protein [Anaerotruncus rubiinfantis]